MSAKPRRRSWLPLIGLALFTLITFFLAFTLRWGLTEWGLLSMDEIVIQLNMSIGGTAPEIMRSFYFQCVLPAVALTIIAMVLCWLPFQRKVRRRLRWGLFTLCIATLAASVAIAWHHFNAGAFFSSEYSELIDASVVTPDSVRLTFPEKKRNLVYIFLESVETTFADCESGGAFADNYMPELTELAQTYEDFSGDSPALNGAIPMTGSTWTIGAMVTHTSGLPMKLHTSDMYSQGLFFPNMRNLGDILHEQGYNQLLMIGSDGNFGGRASLFTQHGDFKVEDYFYAREQGWIPPDYRVFWGYEDMYLFRFAREELLRLAQSEQPFNLTLLTVDTHFPDGYVCQLCGDTYGANQYANVIACSSRQVSEFVRWIQQQDFYENTTIVIAGDHLTMDADFCDNISPDYTRRTYTACINAATAPELNQRREFTTMDMFPTTLAAMGVTIEGNRLGLGTNLFSATPTLLEANGFDELSTQIKKRSKVLERLQTVTLTPGIISSEVKINHRMSEDQRQMTITVKGTSHPFIDAQSLYLSYKPRGSLFKKKLEFTKEENAYVAHWDTGVPGVDTEGYQLYARTRSRKDVLLEEFQWGLNSDLLLSTTVEDYLKSLVNSDYTILIAVRDEATNNLSQEAQALLKQLGLRESLDGQYRCSYLAVIDDGEVKTERIGYEMLTDEGTLSTGARYRIVSAGYLCGTLCKIEIDDLEYAANTRGLNFTVIDPGSGKVISNRAFDTCKKNKKK